jgi:hypothetical protein
VLDTFARNTGFRAQALTAVPRLRPFEVPHYLWSLSRRHRRPPA